MDNDNIGEINALHQLLDSTDYKAAQLIESLVSAMSDATALNFVSKFIGWLSSAIRDYGSIIRQRAEWRAKLRELEGETL